MPRPTPMRPVLLCLSALALLAGCGSEAGDRHGEVVDGPAPVERYGPGCSTRGQVEDAAVVLQADLDGNGALEPLRRTADTLRGCPSRLVSRDGGRTSVVAVPPGSRLTTVTVPGHRGDLVLAMRTTASATSYRLVGLSEGRLRAVTDPDGDPVLPATPRGTGRGLLSARCTTGGLVVDRAVAHEPPGVVFAWDVTTRTYRLDGTVARPVGRTVTQDNVLPAQLKQRAPGLVRPSVLECGS